MLAVNVDVDRPGNTRIIKTVARIMEELGGLSSTQRSGVAPFADGELPTSSHRQEFLTSPLDRNGVEFLTSFMDVMAELPAIKRLDHVRQMSSCYYTSLARDVDGNPIPGMYDHTRAEHSRDVAGLAILAAYKGKFTGEQAMISMMVGYLHDIGHAVFAHTGEEIIREMGFESFNHDLFTVLLASQPDMAEFCADWGINHKDLIACLGGQELLDNYDDYKEMLEGVGKQKIGLDLKPVLDLESEKADEDIARIKKWSTFNELVQVDLDMLSYILRDMHHTEASTERKEKVAALVFETMNAIDIDSDGHLSINGIATYSRLLRTFADNSQERSLSGRTGVFKSFVLRALRRSGITIPDMMYGGEDDTVGMFAEKEREVMLKGTDRYSGIVMSVMPIERSGSGIKVVEDAEPTARMIELRKKMQKRLEEDASLQTLLDGRELLVSTTSPLRKVRDFALRGDALAEAQKSELGEHRIENKYDDDLIVVTTGFIKKGDKYFARFGCYAIESFMISVERRGDEQKDLQRPITNEDKINARARAVIDEFLLESGLAGKFACDKPPVDRLGLGSKRYQ